MYTLADKNIGFNYTIIYEIFNFLFITTKMNVKLVIL